MIGVASLDQMKGPPRGFKGGKRQKPRSGSRKFATLEDGSIIKWWNGEWRFSSKRHNTKVATSLQRRAMCQAIDEGREVTDCERYVTFEDFAERMVGVVGLDQLVKIVQWIKC